jgi:hypothetical protein
MWDEIDKNRLAMVGVVNPVGITRTDYLRDAVVAYNKWFENQVVPKVRAATEEIEEPLGFYVDDGLDIRW